MVPGWHTDPKLRALLGHSLPVPCPANHPTLGFERDLNEEPQVCSKCCHEIDEDHVPLILWNQGGEKAWTFCGRCEAFILDPKRWTVRKKAKPHGE